MAPITDTAAWDARNIYFATLGLALQRCLEARFDKRTREWYSLLEGIVSHYGAAMGEVDQQIIDELNMVNELLHPPVDSHWFRFTVEERESMAFDRLRKIEPVLLSKIYKNGLLTPRRMDPMHAVAQGSHG